MALSAMAQLKLSWLYASTLPSNSGAMAAGRVRGRIAITQYEKVVMVVGGGLFGLKSSVIVPVFVARLGGSQSRCTRR
ncbi:hypothetical protein GCM10025772_23910 [Ferrimonas gelatinilytica]|uniref:Uncharacterized protein n=1 Tax=Ferrimonas gelatinilytica TaxID=1255257 RepID=A0ABP9SA02_9GAMM